VVREIQSIWAVRKLKGRSSTYYEKNCNFSDYPGKHAGMKEKDKTSQNPPTPLNKGVDLFKEERGEKTNAQNGDN